MKWSALAAAITATVKAQKGRPRSAVEPAISASTAAKAIARWVGRTAPHYFQRSGTVGDFGSDGDPFFAPRARRRDGKREPRSLRIPSRCGGAVVESHKDGSLEWAVGCS